MNAFTQDLCGEEILLAAEGPKKECLKHTAEAQQLVPATTSHPGSIVREPPLSELPLRKKRALVPVANRVPPVDDSSILKIW